MQQELIEMLDKMVKYFDEIPSDSYYYRETAAILNEAEKLVEKAKNSAKEPAVPQGYALISVDALRAWGKLDEVEAACVYPTTPAATSQETAVPLELCPTCGEDRPYTGTCGTSDSDTKALCKSKCNAPQEPVTLTDDLRQQLDVALGQVRYLLKDQAEKAAIIAALREKEGK